MSWNGTSLHFEKCSTAHHAMRKPTMINVSSCKPIIILGNPSSLPQTGFGHSALPSLRTGHILLQAPFQCLVTQSNMTPPPTTTSVVLHVFHLLSPLSPLSLHQLHHSVLHSRLIFHTSRSRSPFRHVTISCAWRHKKQTIQGAPIFDIWYI